MVHCLVYQLIEMSHSCRVTRTLDSIKDGRTSSRDAKHRQSVMWSGLRERESMKNYEAITQQQILNRGNLEHHQMSRTKVEAFLIEFPWVKKYALGQINQVYVSRITPQLTQYEPQEQLVGVDPFGGTSYYYERIYFVDGDGRQVDLVNEIKYMARKYVLFGQRIEKLASSQEAEGKIIGKGCSVFSCLQSLEEKAETVRFLVSYYSATQALIIYKVPAGVTLSTWIQQQTKAERSTIQHECQAIDAEVVVVK
jgi:hypothetical protein